VFGVKLKNVTRLAFSVGYCFLAATAIATEPPVTSLAFSPDGKLVVAGSQAGLKVYRWPDLNPDNKLKPAALNIHDLAFSPDGSQLVVGGGNPAEEGTVEIFSWPKAESLHIIKAQKDSVWAVAWRDGSSLVSASLDRSIKLFDTTTKLPIQEFKGHSRGVSAVSLLKDGKTLVSAGIDQSLRVWNLQTGELIRSLDQHTGSVHALAFRPNNEGLPMVASAAEDRTNSFMATDYWANDPVCETQGCAPEYCLAEGWITYPGLMQGWSPSSH